MDCQERRQKIEELLGMYIGRMGRPYTSIEGFAEASGINESNIYNWRNGQRLKTGILRKMASVMGKDIKYLMVLNGDLEEDELERAS